MEEGYLLKKDVGWMGGGEGGYLKKDLIAIRRIMHLFKE